MPETITSHTPGPWDFGRGYTPGDSTFDLFGRGGRQVTAHASYENMWLSAYDKKTDAANARLMASSPEMLDALIAIRGMLSEHEGHISVLGDAFKIADAAISQATHAASKSESPNV